MGWLCAALATTTCPLLSRADVLLRAQIELLPLSGTPCPGKPSDPCETVVTSPSQSSPSPLQPSPWQRLQSRHPDAALSRPRTEPQWVPGRTHSKTIRFSDTPMVQFLATIEDLPRLSPVENREESSHSAGLTFIIAKTTLLSVLGPRAVNDASHHKEPSAVGNRGGGLYGDGRKRLVTAADVDDRGGRIHVEAASSCCALWKTTEGGNMARVASN